MSSKYLDIEKALVNAYLAVDNTTPTEFPNSNLASGSKTALWARVLNERAVNGPVTLGDAGQDDHRGFLQVDINYPEGKGTGQVLQKADELLSYFKAGLSVSYNGQTVTVLSTSLSPGRVVGGYYRVTVTINYYSRTNRN